MHYQQSYESHEPPRLTIPSSAISVDGVAPQTNENPIKGHRLEDGAKLFVSNCLFCHGADGKGDGPVLRIMKADYGYGTDEKPYAITPDLTAQFVKDQSDLSIFGWITNGVTVMPSFDQLLSAEERWLLVNYIRFLGD
jgi:mono/diheme cytochrome c family protein